jgi:hypothetical protein
MKNLIFLFLTVVCFANSSCDKIPSGADSWYYIYINGEQGKQVVVSYLQRDKGNAPTGNVTVTETVTLPYFKETHYVDFIGKNLFRDAFLEVKSLNDSTTKAIAFDFETRLEDSKCGIVQVLNPSKDDMRECEYCRTTSMDSVLRYLKKINYPCYIEFKKTDTAKKVFLYTW